MLKELSIALEVGSLDPYAKIEAAGAHVHWFPDRHELPFIDINYSNYGPAEESVRDYAGYAYAYVSGPAITDDFDLNSQRMAWLKTQGRDVFAAYELNRLRINRIVPVIQGLHVLALDLEDHDIFLSNSLRIKSAELMKTFKEQYRPKLSLEFADLVAGEALSMLKRLDCESRRNF